MDSTIYFIALAIQREPPTHSELQRLLPAIERLVDSLSQSTRLQLTFSATPRPQYSDILLVQNSTSPPNTTVTAITPDQTKTPTDHVHVPIPGRNDSEVAASPPDSDTDIDIDNIDPIIHTDLNTDVIIIQYKKRSRSPSTSSTSQPAYTSSAPSLRLRLLQQH
jgi:hypothetical protein